MVRPDGFSLSLAASLFTLACAPPAPPAPYPPPSAIAHAVGPADAAAASPEPTGSPVPVDAARADVTAETSVPVTVALEYVNLNVEHATMHVDARGRATYSRERAFKEHDAVEPIREAVVGRDLLAALTEEARRLCKAPPRDDEGKIWTRVIVELPDARCDVRLSPTNWKKRAPGFVRATAPIETELCGVMCERPLF